LRRVAGIPLRAREATLAELRTHDLGAGERVPLLTEALELVLGFGAHARINVELKPNVPDPAALARAVSVELRALRQDALARVLLSSFSLAICEALVDLITEVPVAFLYELPPPRLPRGVSAVHPPHVLVDAQVVAALHARGLLVNVWTVNEADRAAVLSDAGVDGIITDDVPSVLGALR
jgi:glycerophosphoryl diester phosphodiesterase